MIVALAAVLGLVFGSFLNVLIVRIPNDQNIAFPASHCPQCKTPLKWWHNIPLFSWIALKGRCAFCGKPISVQYPIVELLTSLLFVAVFLKMGLGISALIYSVVFGLLLALSVIDFRFHAVPDSLNLLALTLAIFGGTVLKSFTDALLMAGGFALLRFYVSFFIKKEAMGEGDIIVAATMGAILGVKLSLVAVFLSAILTLPVSLIYSKPGNKEKEKKNEENPTQHIQHSTFNTNKAPDEADVSSSTQHNNEIPYVPFLVIALWIVFVFDQPITTFLGWLYE